MRMLLTALLLGLSATAQAFELVPQRVADGVYALIGPTGGRTYENHGLNANFGFVVTEQGVLLIDSGASRQGARILEAAVRQVTEQPIRWVVNTGSQDHRWLGNGYFAANGATLIALDRTVQTQRAYAVQHLDSLRRVLKERLDGTEPAYAAEPIDADEGRHVLGGVPVELHWYADAHFPGDVVVWLPEQRVLFSGDHVYVDRMLSVHPWGPAASWREAYRAVRGIPAEVIVPGHGGVTDWAQAQRDTGDYLDWLVSEVGRAAEDWEGLDATVQRLGDAEQWMYLDNFELLHRGNVSRVYVQFENGETGESR